MSEVLGVSRAGFKTIRLEQLNWMTHKLLKILEETLAKLVRILQRKTGRIQHIKERLKLMVNNKLLRQHPQMHQLLLIITTIIISTTSITFCLFYLLRCKGIMGKDPQRQVLLAISVYKVLQQSHKMKLLALVNQ